MGYGDILRFPECITEHEIRKYLVGLTESGDIVFRHNSQEFHHNSRLEGEIDILFKPSSSEEHIRLNFEQDDFSCAYRSVFYTTPSKRLYDAMTRSLSYLADITFQE